MKFMAGNMTLEGYVQFAFNALRKLINEHKDVSTLSGARTDSHGWKFLMCLGKSI